ncbi:hypothetical protein [Roseateles flavus]|uniref:GAPS4 PD-(D/E)XK nuclease domain-containing protein n=1 Tax=Roseateles flavus TaxID=3149041 RepID=A0ABV0GLA9_9BURK
MSGENEAISKMAKYVSDELFSWFKWKRVELQNFNFACVKQAGHAPAKAAEHTHPVDAVFYYHDPYQNRDVFLNTDLKSYAKGSITVAKILPALRSLAQAIDCARVSEEWHDRYVPHDSAYEVRGLLFVYNHDNEYDKSFYDLLFEPINGRGSKEPKQVKLEALPIADGQSIHIYEPQLISYLSSLVVDAARLHKNGTFPETEYEFVYPEMRLHKTSGEKFSRAATVEMLAGPYLIIRHDKVIKYNERSGAPEDRYPEGYVIYYHRSGSSAEEFAYFLDILSGFQILDGGHKIRVRMIHHEPASDPKSNFKRAINNYAQEWGFDKYKLERLREIEFELVEMTKYSFSQTPLAWERQ